MRQAWQPVWPVVLAMALSEQRRDRSASSIRADEPERRDPIGASGHAEAADDGSGKRRPRLDPRADEAL